MRFYILYKNLYQINDFFVFLIVSEIYVNIVNIIQKDIFNAFFQY